MLCSVQYDTNGDGSLDALEMTNVLKSMNLFESDGQVAAIIKGLDANGDGKVQLRELANFLNSKPEKKSRPEEEEEQEARAAHANSFSTWHSHGMRTTARSCAPHVRVRCVCAVHARCAYIGGRPGHGYCFGGRQGHRGWHQRHAGE